MIDKTFVESLTVLAKQADAVKVHQVADNKAIVAIGGVIRDVYIPAPRRNHAAQDIETVVEFAKLFAEGGGVPAIWYNRSNVVCLTDDTDRRDRVAFALTFSDQMKKLQMLEMSQPQMNQRDLIFMLRSVFKDNMGQCPELIASIRQIQSKAAASTDAVVQRGKSSVGKTIAYEASGVGEIPEYVTLTVPVFRNLSAGLMNVTCVLELHEATPAFQLFPLPGELEKAMQDAEANIFTVLSSLLPEEGIPVYYGCP